MEKMLSNDMIGATEQPQENKEKFKPKQFKTSKGSIYMYLPDGRTTRFKVITGENFEPMDLLVFLPPWEKIKDQIPPNYAHFFQGIENSMQYEQLLLGYVQDPDKTVRIVDEKAKPLKTQTDLASADRVFIAFIDKIDGKNNFAIPVAKEPRIGFHTFDAKFTINEEGVEHHQKHLGNKVVDIEYPEKE